MAAVNAVMRRRPRIFRERKAFEDLQDDEIIRRYRLSREAILDLVERVSGILVGRTNRSCPIPILTKVQHFHYVIQIELSYLFRYMFPFTYTYTHFKGVRNVPLFSLYPVQNRIIERRWKGRSLQLSVEKMDISFTRLIHFVSFSLSLNSGIMPFVWNELLCKYTFQIVLFILLPENIVQHQ